VLVGPTSLNALGAPPPSAASRAFALEAAQGCRSRRRLVATIRFQND
jgi:hypothetical protein